MVVTVDFVARRVQQRAFGPVPLKGPRRVGVAEAELADVRRFRQCVRGRIRGKVPRFNFECAHLDPAQVAHARHFGMVLGHASPGPKFFDLLFTRIRAGRLRIGSLGCRRRLLQFDEVQVRIVRFGRAGARNDFGGDDGDRVIAPRAVFFPTDERRA